MNGNAEDEYVGGQQAELVEHYKKRMKAMLPFMRHLNDCAYYKWEVAEFLQKSYGTNYSAGQMPSCTCGAAVLVAIVKSEVGVDW